VRRQKTSLKDPIQWPVHTVRENHPTDYCGGHQYNHHDPRRYLPAPNFSNIWTTTVSTTGCTR
jgi:hypothetical protein